MLLKASLAFLDQGLVTGSNFVIAILLARRLAPGVYGSYAVALQIFLLLMVIYTALVLEPMSVFGPSVYKDRPREYLGALLWIHLGLGLAGMMAVGLSALLVERTVAAPGLAGGLLGVAIAGPCVLLLWLGRRAFYLQVAPRAAASGSLLYCGIALCGIFAAYWLRLLSPLVAFLLMAAGGLVGGLLLLIRLRPSLQLDPRAGALIKVVRQHLQFGSRNLGGSVVGWCVDPPGSGLAEVSRRHWDYGRWVLGESAVSWSGGAIYYLVLGGSRNLAEAGSLKALFNISSPVGQAFVPVTMLLLPYAARVFHRAGLAGARKTAWQLVLLYGGATAAIWAGILILRGPVLQLLYGGMYAKLASLLPWIALGSVFRLLATAQSISLRAIRSPRSVFIAYSASSAVATLVGGPVVWIFGLGGAVLSEILANATAAILTFVLLRRRLRPAVNVGNPVTSLS